MRGVRTVAVALGLCLTSAALVRAGVYNPAEPKWPVDERFETFRANSLIPLRQFGNNKVKDVLHNRYALLAQTAAHVDPQRLTANERLSLSAYLIRERKYSAATEILAPAMRDRQEQDNPLLLANLAVAEYLKGDDRGRTFSSLQVARRIWRKSWSDLPEARRKWLQGLGWARNDFEWYRLAETYLWKVLILRLGKGGAAAATNPLGEDIDPLFAEGRVSPKFVGESGQYEAGKQAEAEKKKIPENAIRIVQQLLIWLPDDIRLYWLLGELYNARGEYLTAGEIFVEIGEKLQSLRSSGPGERTKQEGGAEAKKKTTLTDAPRQVVLPLGSRSPQEFRVVLPKLHRQHLEVLIARAKADQETRPAPRPRQQGDEPPAPNKAKPGPAAKSSDALPLDLRSLGVGFVGGLLVMLFGLWQVREVRRRLGRGAPRGEAAGSGWSAAGPQEGITAKGEEGRPG